MRERDDDVEPRPSSPFSSFSASESPRAAIAGRCASNENGWPCGSGSSSVAPVERQLGEALVGPDGAHLVGLPDEIGRALERRHEVAGASTAARLELVVGSVDLDELAPPLGRRVDRRRLDLPQRALGERRERADLLDLVAEELDPQRLAAGRREDVDQAAADGELPPLLDPLDALVPRRGERARRATSMPGSSPRRDRSGAGRARRPAADGSASAAADAQTSPPRASTSSARARSPTRCGGGSSPEPQRTPRDGSSADLVVADEPAGCLGGVARVGVVGEEHDEAALDLLVQRREHERQHRLRDAGARRQRGREFRQPLLRAQALDECVEHGTVHGVWPNEAFGRGAMVVPR